MWSNSWPHNCPEIWGKQCSVCKLKRFQLPESGLTRWMTSILDHLLQWRFSTLLLFNVDGRKERIEVMLERRVLERKLRMPTANELANVRAKPLRYIAIANSLFCGEYPGKDKADATEAAKRFLDYGIDAIVNFTQLGEKTTNGEELYSYEVDLRDVYQSCGRNLDVHRMAIRDDHPPTLTQAKKFCKLVDRETADGRRVYIHCRGGIGRTATMAAIYLIWSGLADSGTWQKAISSLRKHEFRSAPEPRQVAWINSKWMSPHS